MTPSAFDVLVAKLERFTEVRQRRYLRAVGTDNYKRMAERPEFPTVASARERLERGLVLWAKRQALPKIPIPPDRFAFSGASAEVDSYFGGICSTKPPWVRTFSHVEKDHSAGRYNRNGEPAVPFDTWLTWKSVPLPGDPEFVPYTWGHVDRDEPRRREFVQRQWFEEYLERSLRPDDYRMWRDRAALSLAELASAAGVGRPAIVMREKRVVRLAAEEWRRAFGTELPPDLVRRRRHAS